MTNHPSAVTLDASIHRTARAYCDAGYSVIPIDPDPGRRGGKAPPEGQSWKRYQLKIPSPRTLAQWFLDAQEPRHLAIVCGQVSGNLLVIDFETITAAEETADAFATLHPEHAFLIAGTIKASTPKPGQHWYIKITDPPHSFPSGDKLARRRNTAGQNETLIETRGAGNYVVAPPAPGRAWISPTTPQCSWPYDAVLKLLALCRSFDEGIEPRPAADTERQDKTSNMVPGTRPGDRFAQENDWPTILEPHGWRHLKGRYWQRPGKDGAAVSAVITPQGNLYVFSTNADPFPAGGSVTKFRAHAILNHAGDNTAAARALSKQYGPAIMAVAMNESERQEKRKTIQIDADESRMLSAIMAVVKDDPRLYRLEGVLVTPARRTDQEIDRGGPVLMRESTEGLVRAIVTDRVALVKPDRHGELLPSNCPAYLPRAIIEGAGQPALVPVRSIMGVINGPTLDEDGNLINRPGYANILGNGWYIAHGLTQLFDIVPDRPTRLDAEDAVADLMRALGDFPWKDASLGPLKWITTLLAQIARPLFSRCPATLISANAPGSGKTLLARLIGIVAHGDEPALMAWPAGRPDDSEDETRKRLGALAASGSTLAVIDNLRAGMPWDSDSLNNAITSGCIVDRQLGSNSAGSMRARRFLSQIIGTGNNTMAAGDLADRALVIELETTDSNRREVATDRYRVGEASAYAMSHRHDLLGSALTILSAYMKEGRPPVAGAAWGNFDEYVSLIIGAIRWCTGADPLSDRVTLAQRTDPTAAALLTLCANWLPSFGDLPITARYLETRLSAPDDNDGVIAIAEAVATLGAVKPTAHAIGKTLQRYAGRIIADPATGDRFKLERTERGGRDHACRWIITKA